MWQEGLKAGPPTVSGNVIESSGRLICGSPSRQFCNNENITHLLAKNKGIRLSHWKMSPSRHERHLVVILPMFLPSVGSCPTKPLGSVFSSRVPHPPSMPDPRCSFRVPAPPSMPDPRSKD
ncbi:hypothetical protein H8959_019788 [Pygathrix nigripes]